MSRSDPGAAEGIGVYTDPSPCTCRDPWAVHKPGQRGGRPARTSCSRSGCPCVTYTPEESDG